MASPMVEQQLNMILAADDQASEVITALTEQVAKMAEAMTSAGEDGAEAFDALTESVESFAAAMDAATTSVRDFSRQFDAAFGAASSEAQQAMDGVASATEEAMTAIAEAGQRGVDAVSAAFDEGAAQMQAAYEAAVEETSSAFEELAAAGQDAMDGIAQASESAAEVISTSVAEATQGAVVQMQNLESAAASAMDAVQQAAGAAGSSGGAGAGASAGTSGSSGARGIFGRSSGLLGAAMTGWMTMMGVQMLARSAMGPSQILSVMQATGAARPSQAEQFAGMMSTAGINLAALPAFISGFESRMQSMSTVIGTSGFPKQALLAMQNMGFTGSNPFEDIAAIHSPIQQINAIMAVYQKLASQGQGAQGAAMLNQIGLGQLAPVASQWSTLQQQFAGFNLGMSKQQLQAHATSGLTLNASLAKLGMEFSMLATQLAPLATRIVAAFSAIVSAMSGGGGGGIGAALAAVAEGLAAIKAVQFGQSLLASVPATLNDAAAAIRGAASAFGFSVTTSTTDMTEAEQAAAARMNAAGAQFGGVVLAMGGAMVGELLASGAQIHGAAGVFVAMGTSVAFQIGAMFGPWGIAIVAGAALIALAIEHWSTIKAVAHDAYSAVVAASQRLFAAIQGWMKLHPQAVRVAQDVLDAVSPLYLAITHWQQIKQAAQEAAQALQSAASSLFTALQSAMQAVVNAIHNFISGVVAAAGHAAQAAVSGAASALGLGNASNNQNRVTGGALSADISKALKIAGAPSSWGQAIQWMVGQESGGYTNAVNPVGVNYGGGHGVEHAQGLMQLMPTTFAASKIATAIGSITNPIANLVAGIQRIQTAWGSPYNIPGVMGVGGPYKGYAAGGVLSEPVWGVGASGTRYSFGESGPEAIVPLRGGASGAGGTQTLAIAVTVNSNTALGRQAAQEVAREIVNQLKFRGKFDMSPA